MDKVYDVVIGAEGLTVPVAGDEIEDPAALNGEGRVAVKDEEFEEVREAQERHIGAVQDAAEQMHELCAA